MGGFHSSPKRDLSHARRKTSSSIGGNVSGALADAVPDTSHSQDEHQANVKTVAPHSAEDRCEDKSHQCRNPGQTSHSGLKNNTIEIQDVIHHGLLEKSELEIPHPSSLRVSVDTSSVNQYGQPGKTDAISSETANSPSATVQCGDTHPQQRHLHCTQPSAASVEADHVELNSGLQGTVDQKATKICVDGDPGQTSLSSQENDSTMLHHIQEPGPSCQHVDPGEVQKPNSSPRQERSEVSTDDKTELQAPSCQEKDNFSTARKVLEDEGVHGRSEKSTESEQIANKPSALGTPQMLENPISRNHVAHSVDGEQPAAAGTDSLVQQSLENAEVDKLPEQSAPSGQSAADNIVPDASLQVDSPNSNESSGHPAHSDAPVDNIGSITAREETNANEQRGQSTPAVDVADDSDLPDTPFALENVEDERDIVNPGHTAQEEAAHAGEAHDVHTHGTDVQPNGLGNQGEGDDEQGVDGPEAEAQDQNAQAGDGEDIGAPGPDEQDDDAQSEGAASDGSSASSAPPELTDAEVLYNVAQRLYYGDENMEADPVRATDLHMWAIEDFEHVPSMIAVADESSESDPNKALTFYERAIDSGSAEAMRKLGDLLFSGSEGFDRNVKRAVEMYTRAIDEGNDTLAMTILAEILIEGVQDELEPDPEKAVELYSQLIDEDGDASAMLTLAKILETGMGPVPADPERTVELCKQAIEDGNHYPSMYYLADLLQRGAEGVEKDPERSVTLYMAMIDDSEERETAAMCELANLLLKGCGTVAPNPVRSAQLLQTAVDCGDPFAMHMFATLLEKGQGQLEEDPKRAVELYELAINEHSHIESLYSLANMLRRGCDKVPANHTRAVELYQRAIEEALHCESMFELGRMHENGSDEIDVDLPRAVELYEQAVAVDNHIKSMISLSSLLQRGQDGVPADAKRAFDLLIRAVDEAQSTEAIVALALLLEERRLSS